MSNEKVPVVIFCGGKGTRMKEETEFKPKPMVLIGGRPLLWHIMKIYAHYGYNHFILTLGYRGQMIREYFLNHEFFHRDFTLHTPQNSIEFHDDNADDFKITFVETGLDSLTGERLLMIKRYIKTENFMVTYGDGVADIDINELLALHRKQKTIGTITGAHPNSKYGLLKADKERKLVTDFDQKPLLHDYVNGGFMVFNRKAFDYFSYQPMENAFPILAKQEQLSIYEHEGFWMGIDTYREFEILNELWGAERPWAVWER